MRKTPHERSSILVILSYGPLSVERAARNGVCAVAHTTRAGILSGAHRRVRERRSGGAPMRAVEGRLRSPSQRKRPSTARGGLSVGLLLAGVAALRSGCFRKQIAAWFLSSEPHWVSGGTSGGGERRTPANSPRAWVDRHTRVVTDILCFRAASQGSFARPVTRVYASARWAALRMTRAADVARCSKHAHANPSTCPRVLAALYANLMPLRFRGDDGRRTVLGGASQPGQVEGMQHE
jgi:hypothetical protein